MTNNLIEAMTAVSKLESQIINMESIMNAQHYDAMPENEKSEFNSLLTRRKVKLSNILLRIK